MSEFKSVYAYNLPDTYKKHSESNNYKILNIVQGSAAELEEDTEKVFNSLDIEQATGKTLDLYGEMLGQARGLATDPQYRAMIKSKITRNITNGDMNNIINAACLMFGCAPGEVEITETEAPATVKITGLPYGIINYVGLSVNQTLQLLKELVPVGVKVESIGLDGTFAFSSVENDYDEEKGFCGAEGDTDIGGYFGHLASDENEQALPI